MPKDKRNSHLGPDTGPALSTPFYNLLLMLTLNPVHVNATVALNPRRQGSYWFEIYLPSAKNVWQNCFLDYLSRGLDHDFTHFRFLSAGLRVQGFCGPSWAGGLWLQGLEGWRVCLVECGGHG